MTNHGSQSGSIGRAAVPAGIINVHGSERAGGVRGTPVSMHYFLFLTSNYGVDSSPNSLGVTRRQLCNKSLMTFVGSYVAKHASFSDGLSGGPVN